MLDVRDNSKLSIEPVRSAFSPTLSAYDSAALIAFDSAVLAYP